MNQRKHSFHFLLLFIPLLFVITTFTSCTDSSLTNNGEITICIPKEVYNAALKAYRTAETSEETEGTIILNVSIFNAETKELIVYKDLQKNTSELKELETDKKENIVFDAIPLGTKVYAEAVISINTIETMKGLSDTILVTEGDNALTIKLAYTKTDKNNPDNNKEETPEDKDEEENEITLKIFFRFQKQTGSTEYIENSNYPDIESRLTSQDDKSYESELNTTLNSISSAGYYTLNKTKSTPLTQETNDGGGYNYAGYYYFDVKMEEGTGSIILPAPQNFNIELDTTKSNENQYINNYKFALKATDSEGNIIADDVTWTAKLLYGGKDINANFSYYNFDAETATITTAVTNEGIHTTLGTNGKYQLFAMASYNGESFSRTFNIDIPYDYYYDCEVGSAEYTDMMSKLENIVTKVVIRLTGTGEESVYGNDEMQSDGTMRKIFLALNCDADLDFSELDGITKVSDYEFNMYGSNKSGNRSLILPKTVKSIGSHGFYYCRLLKEITLPEGLKTIGESAFYYCTGLSEVHLPATVEIIDKEAFYESSLTAINIPDAVKLIGTMAFNQLFNLIVTFDGDCANLRALGNQAFYAVGNKTESPFSKTLPGTWVRFSTSQTTTWNGIVAAVKTDSTYEIPDSIGAEAAEPISDSDWEHHYYKIAD